MLGIADARHLHAGLGVGRRYTTWIEERIEKYGFVDGVDFASFEGLSLPDPGASKARAQKTKEYRLTLDVAKELAMVENNETGRMVRRYFIWAEDYEVLLAKTGEQTGRGGRDYTNWIKDRLAKYGVTEGVDYEVSQSPNLVTGKNSRPSSRAPVPARTIAGARESKGRARRGGPDLVRDSGGPLTKRTRGDIAGSLEIITNLFRSFTSRFEFHAIQEAALKSRSPRLPETKPSVETAPAVPAATVRRRMHTLRQVQEELNICHSTTYRLLNSGQLRAVKILGRTLVSDDELQRFIASLPSAFGDVAA